MPERTGKKKEINEQAASIFGQATGDEQPAAEEPDTSGKAPLLWLWGA